jgi:restriction endonuclease
LIFTNEVISCLTPWAKTIVLSACCDIKVTVELWKAGYNLRWISKDKLMKFSDLSEDLKWLITSEPRPSNRLGEDDSQKIQLLTPAWNKLCEYLYQNPNYLHQLNPHDFELLAGEIFRTFGWIVDFTTRTRDGGYDVIAIKRSFPTDMSVLVEAKRFSPNRPVGVDIVRSLYGVKSLYSVSQVVLVTSSYVTSDAKKQFNRVIPWELDFIERDKILEWCKNYRGVDLSGNFNACIAAEIS